MRYNKLFSCFLVFLFFLIGFPEAFAETHGSKFVILPFATASRDKGTSWLTLAIPAEISRRLENYRSLYPAYPEKIFFAGATPLGAYPTEDEVFALCEAHGADFVITGAIAGSNWEPAVTVNAIECRDGGLGRVRVAHKSMKLNSMVPEKRRDGPLVSETDLVDALLTDVLTGLGIMPEAGAWQKMRAGGPRDRYSFFLLVKGLTLYHGYGVEKDLEQSLTILSREARLIDPNFALAHRFLAVVLAETEEERKAIAEYEAAAALQKSDFPSRKALAGLYETRTEYEKALSYAREASGLRPFDAEIYLLRGRLAWLAKKLGEAERALLRAEELNPELLTARRLLARIYAAKNSGGNLIRELEMVVKLEPNDTVSHLELAAAYRKYGEARKAEAAYEEIIQKRPKELTAYKALGDLYCAGSRHAEALEVYRKAIKLTPRDPRFILAAGEINFLKRDYDSAATYFRRAGMSPRVGHYAKHNLAIVAVARGRVHEAREALQNLISAAPNYRLARYNLAVLQVSAGEFVPAIVELEELLRAEPEWADIRQALGAAYFARGDKTRAQAVFEAMVRFTPEDNEARDNLIAVMGESLPHTGMNVYLDRVFPDARGIENLLANAARYEKTLAINRTAFHSGAYELAGNLALAAETAKQKKNRKRGCPEATLAPMYKKVVQSFRQFVAYGKALEETEARLALLSFYGESAVLTSGGQAEFGRIGAAYHDALADLREMHLVLDEELPAELAFGRCESGRLLARQDEPASPAADKQPALVSPPASLPALPLVNRNATFSLDNTRCDKTSIVYVDGTPVGGVPGGKKLSFRFAKGYHSLCFLATDDTRKCGEKGTVHRLFQSGLTFDLRCD